MSEEFRTRSTTEFEESSVLRCDFRPRRRTTSQSEFMLILLVSYMHRSSVTDYLHSTVRSTLSNARMR